MARGPQSRTPGMTHENEPAATGHERFESLPSPVIDLHTSRPTELYSQRSYTLQTNLLQKQAEESPLAPKKIL